MGSVCCPETNDDDSGKDSGQCINQYITFKVKHLN